MGSENEGQDILRCDVCDGPDHPFHCDICETDLCRVCVGDHLLDSSRRHQIVQFEDRGSSLIYSICQTHSSRQCELHCESCDVAICVHCFSSGNHQNHRIVDAKSFFESKKVDIQKDLHEFETIISKKYQDIVDDFIGQKEELKTYSSNLTKDLVKLEEICQRDIKTLFEKLRSDVDKIHKKHSSVLNKEEVKTTSKLSEIKDAIDNLQVLLNSNDVGLVSGYESEISEFRKLPPKLKIMFLPFTFPNIDFKEIYKSFDLLSACCLTTEEHDCNVGKQEVGSTHLEQFLTDPIVVHSITTEYKGFLNLKELRNVVCCNDSEILTSGNDDSIMIYNREGKLLNSIKTNLGKTPRYLAVTRNDDLVYTDSKTRTVYKFSDGQIHAMIKLSWIPRGICSAYNDAFLVIMDGDECKETKVVRYAGFKVIQEIQFRENGRPLYSFGDKIKYISENRNLDVCVANHGAQAVVVVNQAGKFRFEYKGPSSTPTTEPFDPYGISTDSEGQILISDRKNNRIHIVDEDGQFLRYIDNCDLHSPWGLCVDTEDKLYVAESGRGKVKYIQYYTE
nr:uncharacterized protein LOC117691318 [Crassostrea gigas]